MLYDYGFIIYKFGGLDIDKDKEFVFDVVADCEPLNDADIDDGFTLDDDVKQAFYFIYYIFLRRLLLFDCRLCVYTDYMQYFCFSKVSYCNDDAFLPFFIIYFLNQ